MLELVTAIKDHLDLVFKNFIIFCLVDVLADRSDEPPAGVSAVVTRSSALVEKVGNQSVTHG